MRWYHRLYADARKPAMWGGVMTAKESTMPLHTGQVLRERYRVDALLGQGGMGAVYRGTDLTFDAPVAIKENQMVTPESQKQFAREAGLLYRLRHPNLARVIDHFHITGQGQYLVMDYVDGEDLRQVLARGGVVPQARALEWMRQVLDALEYLHREGIIHRDVKPANVKITPKGQVFLVDFGLAKVHDPLQQTTMGARGVTPGYAPPEQYGHGRTDARTDVYSAGATLYALLTGQTPPDALETVTGRAQLVPPREIKPGLAAEVEAAVLQAMETRPSDRFQTAAQFSAALREPPTLLLERSRPRGAAPAARSEPVVVTGGQAREQPRSGLRKATAAQPRQRHPLPRWLLPVAGGIAALLVLVVVVVIAGGSGGGTPSADIAPTATATHRPTATPRITRAPPTEAPVEAPPVEVGFAVMPGGYLEKAIAGEYAGTEVTVDGPLADSEKARFLESMEAFEEATGITVDYIGDKEFETRLSITVDAGDAPDVADFPRPGRAADYARMGQIVDPTTWMSEEWLKQQYNKSWLDMGRVEGPDGQPMSAGVWHRFNGKSLVWYPKDEFEAAGYEIPETWDDLVALTQQIARDGDTAWCIGIESGAASGWVATDWTEELMLRTTSLENYDAWAAGSLPFSSPEVKTAIKTWSEIWFNPDYVFGGTDGIVSTFFGDSPGPMFADPPKCWMHRQGNFITAFFPKDAEAGVDFDFFYFPPVNHAYGKPFLISGNLMSMFNDRPEVRAMMEYLTTPQSASGWLQNGGALAAHQTATPDLYAMDLERGIARLVEKATSFRFDGSDLMPGQVGASSFWTGMTDYVSGTSDLDTVLTEIDASWPR